tara:strand:+ start:570 stop:791 length:222 start_codon:yes stop_codon:yes gene_type:complete
MYAIPSKLKVLLDESNRSLILSLVPSIGYINEDANSEVNIKNQTINKGLNLSFEVKEYDGNISLQLFNKCHNP